jgi:hypothetical protein
MARVGVNQHSVTNESSQRLGRIDYDRLVLLVNLQEEVSSQNRKSTAEADQKTFIAVEGGRR